MVHTTCPKCGKKAIREADTLDTFICSSWYFLRYPDNLNTNAPFNKEIINKILPVDKYVGSSNHSVIFSIASFLFNPSNCSELMWIPSSVKAWSPSFR